jgi:spore maturation protein CgeB
VGHLFAEDHNAFNSTPRAVLNIARDPEADCGFSPEVQVFEAAGAGACVITDDWDGIGQFFEPGEEVLVAKDGDEVVDLLRSLTWMRAEKVGRAAQQRALWEHTYDHRAKLIGTFLVCGRLHTTDAARPHA